MHPAFALLTLLSAIAAAAPVAAHHEDKGIVRCEKQGTWTGMFGKMGLHAAVVDVADCVEALNHIGPEESPLKTLAVSFKTCAVKFDVDSGLEPTELVELAKEAAVAVLDDCESRQGTYIKDGKEVKVSKAEKESRD